MNGKTLVGIALIAGAVLFLLGGDLGGFFAFLLAIGLLVYGWKKWRNAESGGGKALGMAALIFGGILLLSWIPFLIGLLIAALCIYFGWTLIRKDQDAAELVPDSVSEAEPGDRGPQWEDDFESEWKRFLERQKDKK
jgi:lia operon protein LiaI